MLCFPDTSVFVLLFREKLSDSRKKKLTAMSSKLGAAKTGSDEKDGSTNNNDADQISEEERIRRSQTITVQDVLRMTKPTQNYLTKTDENIYKIEFTHFRVRDMKTNKTLFEVRRDPDDDDVIVDDEDPSAGRFVQYRFPPDFLKLKQVGALVGFKVGDKEVKSFRMIERHFFRDQLIKSFDFNFGFCPPNTTNSIEHIYDMPELDSKRVKEMIEKPNETVSDSFYFVDNQLIMHKKATYAFNL